ncbi:MAG: 4Fe-4S binding protein [bacterium]
MIELLRRKARELLISKEVPFIIGYGESWRRVSNGSEERIITPLIISREEEVSSLVWNEHCHFNLSAYLIKKEMKKEIRDRHKIGIIAKGCDAKAISVLIQENQIQRKNLYIIGLTCKGVLAEEKDQLKAEKCSSCELRIPPLFDLFIAFSDGPCKTGEEDFWRKIDFDRKSQGIIEQLDTMSGLERWKYWQDQFQKCVRCYACRNVCPLCYCDTCVADQSDPPWIEKSPLWPGNLFFHIMRVFHLAGRCTHCGACERACPAGIPLTVLNQKMAQLEKGGDENDNQAYYSR